MTFNGSLSVAMVMPTLEGGGAERVAVALSHYFVAQGIGFSFILTKSDKVAYQLPDNVEVECNDFTKKTSAIQQTYFIRSKMKEDHRRVFLSFLADQNILTLAAGLGLKNKVYVSVRNLPSDDFDGNKLLQKIRDGFYRRRADGIVFQTEDQAHYFPREIRTKGVVIPNLLSGRIPAPYQGKRRNVVVASGRLVAQKNYPMLLRSFAILLQSCPDTRLEIYGQGELEESLKEMSVSLGVGHAVVFCGFSDRVLDRVRTASVFAMTSDSEGLSNSLIEALAMGTPTVSTRCDGGGAEAVIRDGITGLLVDKGDVVAMASSMERILLTPSLSKQLSRDAQTIRFELNSDAIGTRWLELLSDGACR